MFSKVRSAAICGIESRIVSVEVDVANGLPQFSMVGFLNAQVREAQDRVRTAIKNSGYSLAPKKVTVNLAPADIRKSGPGFDLPIAVAVMASYGFFPGDMLERIFLAGELGLDGSIRGICGVLGMVLEARRAGCESCIIPEANVREGAVIQGIQVFGAGHLKEVVEHFISRRKLHIASINIEEMFSEMPVRTMPDFADIKGQHTVKRAAEIAAAGMHNLLISGTPGSGKTMIASRIPGILPLMDIEESLEVSKIHSVAGLLPSTGILRERPFRMPHHTVSPVALTGGGGVPRPGEISLAHRGVLYLDELPEFQKEALEILRQPLEEGEIRISRNSGQYVFPADFMLVASRNPCKCGYYPDRTRCHCHEHEVMRYLHKISRPLLDRIDLHAEAEQVQYEELVQESGEETTAQIRKRVLAAQSLQKIRYDGSRFRFNAELTAAELEHYCPMEDEVKAQLKHVYEQKRLTARSYHKVIKVARTIADLEGCEVIGLRHLGEAVYYRPADGLQ